MRRRDAHLMVGPGAAPFMRAPLAPGAPASGRGFWHTGRAVVIGLVLFAILGLTMGYTISGWGAWLALAAPIAFALLTAVATGLDGSQLLVLVLALVITGGAVLLGKLIDRQFSSE